MKILKFLHFHLSIDPRADEIMNLILLKDKNHLLNKQVTSLFKNRWTQYIPWLINNSNQSSQEMAESIYKDISEYS